MHQNMSLEYNLMDQVRSFRKIAMWLRTTNFCTSSARFAPSFVSQLNGPKCSQILWNAPKHLFRVHWGGMGAFVAKNSDNASWHELLHHFGPFSSSFVSQLNGPKCTKILWNAPKHFLGAMGWIGCVRCQKFRRDFEARTFAPLRPFCTEFCNSTKRSQMHQNCTKCTKTWV